MPEERQLVRFAMTEQEWRFVAAFVLAAMDMFSRSPPANWDAQKDFCMAVGAGPAIKLQIQICDALGFTGDLSAHRAFVAQHEAIMAGK